MHATVLAVAFSLSALVPSAAFAAERTAIFAGGCFWCMESDFEKVPGVGDVVSGYIGGEAENPTYKNHSGHVEAVRIPYDDEQVSYERLLEIFWRSVDPTDDRGQFCDRGHSYTTAIFALDEEQLEQAQASKAALEESGKLNAPIVPPIRKAGEFTVAEGYHQDYYEKNPLRYRFYQLSCGRDKRVEQLWGAEAHGGVERGS